MFHELSKARWLKAKATTDSATTGFFGRVASIAAVHQYGERDKVDPNGPVYHYPQRKLLGFSDRDRTLIRDLLIDYLGR
jgi:phage virion morphogenesis protein